MIKMKKTKVRYCILRILSDNNITDDILKQLLRPIQHDM